MATGNNLHFDAEELLPNEDVVAVLERSFADDAHEQALGAWSSHYDRAAFVDMGVAAPEASAAAATRARDDADRRGWRFAKLAGELLLVRGLIDGAWDPADYLVLQPGQRLGMSYDESVIRAEPVPAAP